MQSFTIEEIKKIHQVWKKSNFAPPVPPARGSLTHSQALSLSLSKRARDVTALRCSEPLRSGVGGASKALAIFCGMGPPCCCMMLVSFCENLYPAKCNT